MFLALFSFLSHLIILYWLPRVMIKYGGTSPLLSIIALFSLSLYIALFSGILGLLGSYFFRITRYAIFIIPILWITKDFALETLLTGFPWCLLGYSQYKHIILLQWADLGGIHFISFIIIMINCLVYSCFKFHQRFFKVILIFFVLIFELGGWSKLISFQQHFSSKSKEFAGIIQPNVSHDTQFSLSTIDSRLRKLFQQSISLSNQGASFIVWPEFTVPIYPMQSEFYLRKFQTFSSDHVPIIAGFTDFQDYQHIYNSVFLFCKEKTNQYNKVHLAPFGEYIPFRKALFFIKKITDEIGDFTPGDRIENLNCLGHSFSVPICFEIIYPELVRAFTRKGGEIIITISNDSWFGFTSAPFQHLAMSVFRAVENRRYLLRSTSNGISAAIAPDGKIITSIPYGDEDTLIAPFSYLSQISFFTRIGYLFPYSCFGISMVVILLTLIPAWKKNDYKSRKHVI